MAISFEKMGQQVWVQDPSWPVWTFTCMRFVCWAWINDFLVMDLHLWCQVPITGWMGQRLCATVKDPREIINNLACVILCSHSNLRGRMFWVRTVETKRHRVRHPQLPSKCWSRKAGSKHQLSSEVSPSWPSPHSLLCVCTSWCPLPVCWNRLCPTPGTLWFPMSESRAVWREGPALPICCLHWGSAEMTIYLGCRVSLASNKWTPSWPAGGEQCD